jgi:hypothetical protein
MRKPNAAHRLVGVLAERGAWHVLNTSQNIVAVVIFLGAV